MEKLWEYTLNVNHYIQFRHPRPLIWCSDRRVQNVASLDPLHIKWQVTTTTPLQSSPSGSWTYDVCKRPPERRIIKELNQSYKNLLLNADRGSKNLKILLMSYMHVPLPRFLARGRFFAGDATAIFINLGSGGARIVLTPCRPKRFSPSNAI